MNDGTAVFSTTPTKHPRKGVDALGKRDYVDPMRAFPVEVEHGVLRIPNDCKLPEHTRLAVLVLEDKTDAEVAAFAQMGGGLDFLKEEPDLYSDNDVLPDRRNLRFKGSA